MDIAGGNGGVPPRRSGGSTEAQARWQRLVRDHEASGSTVRDFCRDRGVNEHSFYVWRHKLVGGKDRTRHGGVPTTRRRARSSARGAFVPVRLAPAVESPGGSDIEISFPSGHVLRVSRHVDAETLARVVGVLDARSC